MSPSHFLVVTFPAQGHLNPALQFAKRLIQNGARVTFATSVFASKRMSKLPNPEGLRFATFSDGYDDGFKPAEDNVDHYMSEMKRRGSETLRDLIASCADEGRPITCLIYTLLLPWASKVARDINLPSALLWIQPATVLDIYYYYFYGYGDAVREKCNSTDPSSFIEFPGLPVRFLGHDLPSFLVPGNPKEYAFIISTFREQLKELENEANPRILVNTFDALEPEALTAISKYKLTGIGPLVPSAFLDGKDPSDNSFGGDLFQGTKDYREWLDSKSEASVIYVSFGSIAVISMKQTEELARGLLDTGKPFLWVIRARPDGQEEKEEDKISCMDELEQLGMIVPWCTQLEVLSHPSLGCFMTHCGWNSTLESLALGVPVVAFPQWTDQGTNAKLIEEVWGTGVRVRANDERIVERDEIKRCLEIVMRGGERREEMRRNALKWKELAIDAAKQGGSSDTNLKAFVQDVSEGCHL